MKLNKELLEKVRNDKILILHTKNNKILLGKLFNLLDEMGFVWRTGTKLKTNISCNMQYIYIGRVKLLGIII